MSASANVLSEGDIDATNVRPALETSLRFGVTEAELEAELGWRRADLERPGAWVTGASTYRHMEIMHERLRGGSSAEPSRYAAFVLAAVHTHEIASLGVVGLACKTATNVGAAIACHGRFQHLTNRTARYETSIAHGRLHLREHRPGPPRLGSQLISDYAMFVAVRLLTLVAGREPVTLAMHSRRSEMPAVEREPYEAFLGVEIELGAANAELVFDASLVDTPVARADPELEAYFRSVLERAAGAPVVEPQILADARAVIRERLIHGTPTVDDVARSLAIGARTLQRRLAEHGLGFADLLDTTRRTLAENYLRRSELTLAEIAYMLGYVEQASFFRAFRRWHGETTPDAFRRGT